MAGAGYKLFNTGDVLTAAQVNTYLQEQTVMVFANASARTTALSGVLAEGMVSFLKDTDALEIYSGTAWVGYGSGDITGVTAGTGISGGGTSGTVTVTNSMATEITAAGDIIVGTGSGTFDNLPIGTTGQVLTADTTVSPYKVKWATAASGGSWTLLSTTTLSGSSTTISISGTYKRIMAVWDGINPSATSQISIEPNSAGSNATYVDFYNAGSTGSTAYYDGTIRPGAQQNFYAGNTSNRGAIVIENADTTVGKPFYIGGSQAHVVSGRNTMMGVGQITTGSAISALKFVVDSGSFNGGTVRVYGE